MTDNTIFMYEMCDMFMHRDEFLSTQSKDYVEAPIYLTEMATVDTKHGYRFAVNPDPNRIDNPYFKVFNSTNLQKDGAHRSKVARFHFLDNEMEYHRDQYDEWHMSNTTMKDIIKKLNMKAVKSEHTIWEMLCYKWNYEYGFIDHGDFDEDMYFDGMYDLQFLDHPSYIPSTALIPEHGWVYNPPLKR